MPPTISVVIPTYNAVRWIEETLDSVLQQTYGHENIELIVIDDASPDNSVSVARSFLDGKGLNCQVVERKNNCGAAATRNAGWRMATGAWVQFVDQDDLLMPGKLKLQADSAAGAASDVAVVYSSWQSLEMINDGWEPTGVVNAPFVDDDTVVSILKEAAFGYVGPTLIRREALAGVGGFEEQANISEDMNLMLRMAMAGGKFREACSEGGPAFLYRQTPGSLWKSYAKNVVAMRNMLLTFRMAEEFLRKRRPDGQLSDDARHALAVRYTSWADFFIEHDPASFRQIELWLRGLGFDQPPNLGAGMRAVSSAFGYKNALRLRTKYRMLQFKR